MKVLVFRFSAMGDVAMTAPVIRELSEQHPNLKITYVSRPFFAPFFDGIAGLEFFGADLNGAHKGPKGLFNLYRELNKKYKPDVVIDLHSVLRTHLLSTYFRVSGTKVFTLDKGRKEKKLLTRPENKKLNPLMPMTERYAEVFREAGLSLVLRHRIKPAPEALSEELIKIVGNKNKKWLGVAPFAQHSGKMFPEEKMLHTLKCLQDDDIQILLFGGGAKEIAALNKWEAELPNAISLAGKIRLGDELAAISQLDAMVSMDSANMHLASLKGIPVVSVWGATHPYVGFMGYGQSMDNAVQVDEHCRPCSVFGNKPCIRDKQYCMTRIEENDLVDKIREVLGE